MIHEYLDGGPVMALFLEQRRFVLDTGEEAEIVDDNTFAVKRTGERLVRIDAS
jgi:hypothetical protein